MPLPSPSQTALRSPIPDASLADHEVRAALAQADDPAASPAERAEMLMEIAQGLQRRPRSADVLHDAIALYRRARALLADDEPLRATAHALLAARAWAREATAHQALPDGGVPALRTARECLEAALPVIEAQGLPTELAEVRMNLGLVEQGLAASHAGRIQDAIAHYHRALRTFTREAWPREFAVLHNNLAIAYLSIPATDERARIREALAVQSFEQVLQVVDPVEHPVEYAMTQNNLGNALQYAPTGHPVANLLRAIEAYDEALKVRSATVTPLEYAKTVANKANALASLPDDPQQPGPDNPRNRTAAIALYAQAAAIFGRFGQDQARRQVDEAIAELQPTTPPAEPRPAEAGAGAARC